MLSTVGFEPPEHPPQHPAFSSWTVCWSNSGLSAADLLPSCSTTPNETQSISHSNCSPLAKACISVFQQGLTASFQTQDFPRPDWLISKWAEKPCVGPGLLSQSSIIWQLQNGVMRQLCCCRASWCHMLSCCHKSKGCFGKLGSEQWYQWCLGTAKAHTPLPGLAMRNSTVSWKMIWALKQIQNTCPVHFLKLLETSCIKVTGS